MTEQGVLFLCSCKSKICYHGGICILTRMEKIVGPRMSRKSNSLEFVVQHSVSSRRERPAIQGSTKRAGSPAIHTLVLQLSMVHVSKPKPTAKLSLQVPRRNGM
jgi:hypothetical protein